MDGSERMCGVWGAVDVLADIASCSFSRGMVTNREANRWLLRPALRIGDTGNTRTQWNDMFSG